MKNKFFVTEGQISLDEYLKESSGPEFWCKECVCKKCMYWWSHRCPYGECYDDYREKANPYDKAHPDEPPRTAWTNWKTDQGFWCRGGSFYPVKYCEHWYPYNGQVVKECLFANVSVFEDGYILCSIIDTVGCEECYRRFEEKEK